MSPHLPPPPPTLPTSDSEFTRYRLTRSWLPKVWLAPPPPPTLKTAIRKFNKKSASRACVPSKRGLQCYRARNATEQAIALSVTATEHGRQLISAVDWTLLLLCKMCGCGFANCASVALQIVQHTHTHYHSV